MSGFNFDVNSELNSIRKKPGTGASKPAEAKPPAPPPEPEARPVPKAPVPEPLPQPAPRDVPVPEPEGFGIDQSHQESNNSSAPKPRRVSDPVNWKGFKPLKGVFDYVGGDRPVILREPIRRAQVSGVPDPLMFVIQEQLKEKYNGAIVEFPWGAYEIDERNKVFTAKPSLLRYLLFDGLRDGNGLQVQYAKQWLVGHMPTVFDVNFKPDVLKPSDELDIYALLLVSYLSEAPLTTETKTESDYQASDQLSLMNSNMSRLMDMVNTQSTALESLREHNDTLQTVTLLDRMGLLRGGLPKDPGEFVRVLEQNRGAVETMSATVNEHIKAEKERQRVLQREARMKSAYVQRR